MTDAWMWTALAVIVLAAVWIFRAEAVSDTPPAAPPDRPPTENDVKTALADMRASVDRLGVKIDRRTDDVNDELQAICRQLDRIESTRRLEDALVAIRRQDREN